MPAPLKAFARQCLCSSPTVAVNVRRRFSGAAEVRMSTTLEGLRCCRSESTGPPSPPKRTVSSAKARSSRSSRRAISLVPLTATHA